MPQLQINQGPQDALLYDNTRSYFTNVGYTRTSNFQVEYREVDAQNSMQFGSTVQYVIPKAADLLGAVDLRVTIPEPTDPGFETVEAVTGTRAYTQWVDELGFAMIEKVTFSVGSNDIETITGEQMQIKNELMTSDEQRLGFEHVMKTGRPAFSQADPTRISNEELPGTNEVGKIGTSLANLATTSCSKAVNKDYTRLIGVSHYGTASVTAASGARQLIIPLNLFFTKHVSQYFPLAAVAGCNDVRISVKFRALKDLVQFGGKCTDADRADVKLKLPTFGQVEAKLMCHYVHVTGPEATTLMNKEHVRLLKLWQHQHKTFDSISNNSLDLDLSFLHPITTLVVVIRRANDMNSETEWKDGGPHGVVGANTGSKGYFFYHGDGTNPNYDQKGNLFDVAGASAPLTGTVRVKSMQLTLNGQERHPGLSAGIDAEYLQSRLLPMLHSNSNSVQKQLLASATGGAGNSEPDKTVEQQKYGMQGSKNIFVYPFSLNPEGTNPSGAVNFSKVSHAKLAIRLDSSDTTGSPIAAAATGMPGDSAATKSPLRVDVYGLYYNWLQIKSGRALLSFA